MGWWMRTTLTINGLEWHGGLLSGHAAGASPRQMLLTSCSHRDLDSGEGYHAVQERRCSPHGADLEQMRPSDEFAQFDHRAAGSSGQVASACNHRCGWRTSSSGYLALRSTSPIGQTCFRSSSAGRRCPLHRWPSSKFALVRDRTASTQMLGMDCSVSGMIRARCPFSASSVRRGA